MKERLRDLRIENELTQKELAQKIGSTDKSIWNYEKGIATPPYDILIAYAKLFEVSTDYLLGLENDSGIKPIKATTIGYSSEERNLVNNYRELNQSGKKLVNETIKTLLAASAKSNEYKDKI